jgi:hypothetical protein
VGEAGAGRAGRGAAGGSGRRDRGRGARADEQYVTEPRNPNILRIADTHDISINLAQNCDSKDAYKTE